MKNCVQSAVMEGSRQLKESKNALLIIGGCPWYITVGPSYLQGNLQSLLPLISSLYHIPYDSWKQIVDSRNQLYLWRLSSC
ncbi:uncharacterized protein LOC108227501 isoform X3 [Daucus carota subsp. sativus]|uniref:uncharacterized protein LOC108227501 isoform X3 n=1 Tax=Daucus carota subsp. sativus TaxID=79200 RepID=UPI00308358D9